MLFQSSGVFGGGLYHFFYYLYKYRIFKEIPGPAKGCRWPVGGGGGVFKRLYATGTDTSDVLIVNLKKYTGYCGIPPYSQFCLGLCCEVYSWRWLTHKMGFSCHPL